MTGPSRRARGPMVLPWRTACLAVVFGALVLRTSPPDEVQAEDAAGYAPAELRAALNGAVPSGPSPVVLSAPEGLARELPEPEQVTPAPAEGPSVAPTAVDVVPASYTGASR